MTQDEEEPFRVEAATWHQASDHDRSEISDYGVVLLSSTCAPTPMDFPPARRLDDLAARGALRPTTVFDNVGYGAIPIFKEGPAEDVFPDRRMFYTSRFLGLTRSTLKLLMNADAGEDLGGV